MPIAKAARRRAGGKDDSGLIREQRRHRVEHRDVDVLPMARLLSRQKRQQHALRGEHASDDVGHRHALAADTRAGWTARLVPAGVPCGPVRAVDEALADAQLAARGMIERLAHPTAGDISVLGVPIKLSATPGGVRAAPPTLGEHTAAVLKEIGLSDDEIARLKRSRVV